MVAVDPCNFFGWHNLAVQYQLQGRIDEAIAADRRSIECHPGKGNLLARTSLANLLARAGRPEEAAEAWRAALETDPSSAEALRHVAGEHMRRGDVEGALAVIEEALERAPDALSHYEELARVHAARGQRPLVLQAWHRAAEAIPESARARHGVGAALLELDRDADARPWLEQAFAMDNNDVELAVDYARLLARGGQRDTARNLLDQVLALSPGHPRAAAARRAIQAGQRP
jgi:tetratricopeptide (TPR) repeat protein